MSVADIVTLVVYVVGWFVAVRIAWSQLDRTDPEEYGLDVGLAIFAGFFWPVLLAILVGVGIPYGLFKLATAPLPKVPRPRLRRRSDPEYIAYLQRQLGIKEDR